MCTLDAMEGSLDNLTTVLEQHLTRMCTLLAMNTDNVLKQDGAVHVRDWLTVTMATTGDCRLQ